MQKGMKKHEDKEHSKTLKHKAPSSINHKATQNKNKPFLSWYPLLQFSLYSTTFSLAWHHKSREQLG